jgi:lysozyme family protein
MPGATAADVKAMKIEQADSIYRAEYWDAQRCDDLPAGVDYAVFDYGVNSGIGRSGKVLRRLLKRPDNTSVIDDAVIAAAHVADAKMLIAAICDERLRFLRSLKTWSVFGKGWNARVTEVRAAALAMAQGAVAPTPVNAPAQGRGVVPVSKPAQHGSAAAIVVASAAAAQQAHQSGAGPGIIAVIVAATALFIVGGWLFWRWRQRQRQEQPA